MGLGGCETTMIIAAFVEGIRKKKNPTGCYTGLAFMKKDTDVNDCESPPNHHQQHPPIPKKERKKDRKIETSTELSKWQIQAPSVHAEHPASIHFFR